MLAPGLACIHSLRSAGVHARRGKPVEVEPDVKSDHQTKSLFHLRCAFDAGYDKLSHVLEDTDLDPVRSLPEFETLVKAWREKLESKN